MTNLASRSTSRSSRLVAALTMLRKPTQLQQMPLTLPATLCTIAGCGSPLGPAALMVQVCAWHGPQSADGLHLPSLVQ